VLQPPTLEFAIVLNAALFTRRPHFLISLFSPPYILFWHFENKIVTYDPNLALGALFWAFTY
jgi:hypothetical protein